MSFKDLLVHLGDARSCSDRVMMALELAKVHEAYLTGLYVVADPVLSGSAFGLVPEEALEEERQFLKEQAEATTARFREDVGGHKSSIAEPQESAVSAAGRSKKMNQTVRISESGPIFGQKR